jgi:hypothetical protein
MPYRQVTENELTFSESHRDESDLFSKEIDWSETRQSHPLQPPKQASLGSFPESLESMRA